MRRPAQLPPQLLKGPFTTAEALAAGVSEATLRTLAVRRVKQGLYLPAHLAGTARERALAALRTAPPGTLIGGLTALRAWGIGLPKRLDADREICLIMPAEARWRAVPGIRAHRVRRPVLSLPADSAFAAPPDVWALLAPRLTLDELVMVGDALMRRDQSLTSRAAMELAVKRACHTPGVAALRAAFELIRPNSQSFPETMLRLAIVRAGFPVPLVNGQVRLKDGAIVYPDLSYPECRIAIEYDGLDHFRTDAARAADARRQRALEAEGWIVLRVTAQDLRDPALFLSELRRALAGRTPKSW